MGPGRVGGCGGFGRRVLAESVQQQQGGTVAVADEVQRQRRATVVEVNRGHRGAPRKSAIRSAMACGASIWRK